MQKTKTNTVLAIFLATFAVMLIGGLIVIGDGYHYFSAAAQLQQSPQFQPQEPQPFQPPQQQPQPFAPSPSPTPSPSQPGMLPPTQPQQQPPIDPQSVQYLTYENREAKIKVDYPSHWQQVPVQPPDVVGFANPQTSSFVAILAAPVQQGTTLEQTIPIKINSLSNFFPGFQLLAQGPVTMDGKDAINIAYSFTDPQGNPLLGMSAWTISEDIEYDFRYIAPPNQFYSEALIANHMSATFDILDSFFE